MPQTPTLDIRRAFSLIELLVVIAIIALLIGILLPALSRARDGARTTVCQTRVRQLALAGLMYAQDNDEQIWSANTWLRESQDPEIAANISDEENRWGTAPGRLFDYVDGAGEIVSCPTNKRRGNGTDMSLLLINGDEDLDTDFSMVGNVHGYRTYREVWAGYHEDPSVRTPFIGRRTDDADRVQRFTSMPFLVEENTSHVVNGVDANDARWLGVDKLSNRHGGKATISLIDGSGIVFKLGDGPHAQSEIPDAQNFDTRNLRFYGRAVGEGEQGGRGWIYHGTGGSPKDYGWINNPVLEEAR